MTPDQDWAEVVKAYDELAAARFKFYGVRREFLLNSPQVLESLRRGLSGRDQFAALDLAAELPPESLKDVLPELVGLASSMNAPFHLARPLILSLPREWTLRNIEAAAERWLADGTYDEFRRMLELFIMLDKSMTRRLAERAAASEDKDIRDAGVDYL